MRKTLFSGTALAVMTAACFANTASASTFFDTFGPLPDATFGGQGIPNDEVAMSSQFVDGDNTITIALSATQRFFNPALSNDGAGTYFADPGTNFGDPNNPADLSRGEGSKWNFNFYINVSGDTGTPQVTDYQFDFFYDFDPAESNSIATYGGINITNSVAAGATPNAATVETSQNATFGFLGNSVPGFITAPVTSFDPDAEGKYGFVLQVRNAAGFTLEAVGIDVVVPEPSAFAILGAAGLALFRRRSA